MSAENGEDRPLVRMVTAPYRSQADEEMTAIGLLYGLGLVLVLLPLLPFIVLAWLVGAVRESMAAGAEE
ncbi:MAG: hypothetical protein ABEJ92_02605 [Halobacteriales archaeon]